MLPNSSNDDVLRVFSRDEKRIAALSAASHPIASTVRGTVDAAVAAPDHQIYGLDNPALISGGALGRRVAMREGRPLPPARRIHANDMISELREISREVNRMMSQVERAIDHLAVNAW
jgi:HAMP domain-containing protein